MPDYLCGFEVSFHLDKDGKYRAETCGAKASHKYKGVHLCKDHAEYGFSMYGIPASEYDKYKIKEHK